jgi:hypothetical protein
MYGRCDANTVIDRKACIDRPRFAHPRSVVDSATSRDRVTLGYDNRPKVWPMQSA